MNISGNLTNNSYVRDYFLRTSRLSGGGGDLISANIGEKVKFLLSSRCKTPGIGVKRHKFHRYMLKLAVTSFSDI